MVTRLLGKFEFSNVTSNNNQGRTSAKIPEMRIALNFDQEKGRQPRPGREPDIVYCHIKPTKSIRMAVIKAYLDKQMPFDNVILEAISK